MMTRRKRFYVQADTLVNIGEREMTDINETIETIADILVKEGVRILSPKELDREIREMQSEYAGNLRNKFKDGVNGVKKRVAEILSKYPDVTREQLHSAILTVTANPAASRKEVSYVVLRYTGTSWLCGSVGSLRDMRDKLILKGDTDWYPVR